MTNELAMQYVAPAIENETKEQTMLRLAKAYKIVQSAQVKALNEGLQAHWYVLYTLCKEIETQQKDLLTANPDLMRMILQ